MSTSVTICISKLVNFVNPRFKLNASQQHLVPYFETFANFPAFTKANLCGSQQSGVLAADKRGGQEYQFLRKISLCENMFESLFLLLC